jgi:hypothetical protein
LHGEFVLRPDYDRENYALSDIWLKLACWGVFRNTEQQIEEEDREGEGDGIKEFKWAVIKYKGEGL